MIIKEVKTKKDYGMFIKFQYDLYKNDKNFVPILKKDAKNMIYPDKNILWKKGKHKLFLALSSYNNSNKNNKNKNNNSNKNKNNNNNKNYNYNYNYNYNNNNNGKNDKNDKNMVIVGRIAAGINEQINKKPINKLKNLKEGYITLFEVVEDYNVAKALFDKALDYLKDEGAGFVRGPISPTNGDEYRGCLIEGFDYPPVFLNAYNKKYYKDFFEKYGFKKYLDLYAYRYDIEKIDFEKYLKILEYAKKKYKFDIYPISMKNLERDLYDIKMVIENSMPEEWPDLIPPDISEIKKMAKQLKPFVVPEYVLIARNNKGKPIGFNLSMLDFNEVLKKLNGRFYPWNIFKIFKYKKKIKTGRSFVMFVDPAYRKKGVSHALYIQLFYNAHKNGLKYAEGSTIGETNYQMRKDAEKLGGIKYKTYRIYEKKLII